MAPTSKERRKAALETALKMDRVGKRIAQLNGLGMNGPKMVENMKKEVKRDA